MAEKEPQTGNQPEPASAATPAPDPAPEPQPETVPKSEYEAARQGFYTKSEELAAAKRELEEARAALAAKKDDAQTAELIKQLAEGSSDPEAIGKLGSMVQQLQQKVATQEKEMGALKLQTRGIAQRTIESVAADALAKTGVKMPDSWRRKAVSEIRDAAGARYHAQGGNFEDHIAAAARQYAKDWKELGSHFSKGAAPAPPASAAEPAPPVPQGGAAPPSPAPEPKQIDISSIEGEEDIRGLWKDYLARAQGGE